MVPEEYEQRYTEALDVVRRKLVGSTVGDPEATPGGARFVYIDGMPCTDQVIFRMAWGEVAARDIIQQERAETHTKITKLMPEARDEVRGNLKTDAKNK
jgi:hypothetical protein